MKIDSYILYDSFFQKEKPGLAQCRGEWGAFSWEVNEKALHSVF